MQSYKAKTFSNLKNLKGVTDLEIEEHLKLYTGYINNSNKLIELLNDKIAKNDFEGPQFSELVRRIGFEFNGLRLHELYFENLNGKAGDENKAPKLKKMIEKNFGNLEDFKNYFLKVAAIRGTGWALLCQNCDNEYLSVHWINDHENGHVAGFEPIVVMDCWEHAWTAYLKPTERAKYIEDFWANIDWKICEERLA
jgi:Fe-Mn family superoxide dismutase